MGPAQPNKALSHLEKPGARAAKGTFSPRPGGRQAAAPKPRISRCGTGPSCARAFHLQPFCHFPVRSRLRDVPRRSQTRRFPISKSQGRGLLRVRFSRVRRAASCRAQAAHIPLRDGPLLRPRFSFAAIFVISRSAAACVTWGRRSQTRRFPISKSQGRGPLRARFPPDPAGGKLPRPSRAHPAAGQGPPAPALFVCSHFCHFPVRSRLRDMPRCSRLHLLGVCGMINTAQALGPRKGRGGAPCRDRRGRYGT